MTAAVGLRLVPITLAQANEHVAAWHRHNDPVVGHKFSVGAIEVLRVASDGHRNACSMIYGALGRPVTVLIQWAGRGPRNVLVEREDGSRVVRPFRGLRRPVSPTSGDPSSTDDPSSLS